MIKRIMYIFMIYATIFINGIWAMDLTEADSKDFYANPYPFRRSIFFEGKFINLTNDNLEIVVTKKSNLTDEDLIMAKGILKPNTFYSYFIPPNSSVTISTKTSHATFELNKDLHKKPGFTKPDRGQSAIGENVVIQNNSILIKQDDVTIKTLQLMPKEVDSIEDYINIHGQPKVENGTLDLSNKGITSLQGIEKIKNPKNIRTLNLANNDIQTVPPHIFDRFTQLQNLDLSYNQLKELPNNAFVNLLFLENLNLSYNILSDLANYTFKKLSNLHNLDLSHNQLTKLSEPVFSDLSGLRNLNLSYNQLNTLTERVFLHLYNLRNLNLRNNPLEKSAEEIMKEYFPRRQVTIEK